jgi:hypothetical protein
MKKAKVTNALEILNWRHPPAGEDIELRTAFRQQAHINPTSDEPSCEARKF